MSNDKFDTARQVLRQQKLTGERALFQSENLAVYDSVFEDGESPLKESSSLYLDNCLFRWKYPLWYCKHVDVKECTWFDMARAGVWYTDDISVRDSIVEAPKNFRRCRGYRNLKILRQIFQDITAAGCTTAVQKKARHLFFFLGMFKKLIKLPLIISFIQSCYLLFLSIYGSSAVNYFTIPIQHIISHEMFFAYLKI